MAESKTSGNCLERVTLSLVTGMERAFYRHGRRVASRPVRYIVACFVFTGLCCLGFLNFFMETRPEKLWIPQESDHVMAMSWRAENFPSKQRIELALFEADNVLTPMVIKEMYRVYRQVAAITITDEFGQEKNQTNLCFRVPALGQSSMDFLPTSTLTSTDWSIVFGSTIYCKVRSLIPEQCLQLGLLDIWGDDEAKIMSLTQQDIVNDLNTVTVSKSYLFPMDFSQFLGGIERNSSGHIVRAKATLYHWNMEINSTAVELAVSTSMVSGMDTEVDGPLLAWEGEFIKQVLNDSERPRGVTAYITTERSFGEISGDTILGDVAFLVMGNTVLFIYVNLMLGRFNFVEQRPLLSMIGLLSTYMSVLVSFGLCSAMGLPYGPVHSILPLLLLGLGVDDMFVMVQCWNNLPVQSRKDMTIREQVGRSLKHAGVAITVTSLTDVFAFAIGATTVLPALRSFCIYSAVGIVALYCFQTTFFVAWFSLDQTRMEGNRNGLFWCYQHKNYTPNECSQVDLCTSFFDKVYSKLLLCTAGKVVTLVATAALLAVSAWGVSNLRQEFNPVWFIPQSSYLFQFLNKTEYYFPNAGSRGEVYLGELDYPSELPKIDNITRELLDEPSIHSVDSWYLQLANYTYRDTGEDILGQQLDESLFHEMLGKFLYSPSGSRYLSYFKFAGNTSCGSSTTRILASKFDYQHDLLGDRNSQIEAMDRVKNIVKRQNFSAFAAPVARSYSSWETDKVITEELVRNLLLALLMVLLMTILLLANLSTALCVFFCVTMTLVEVMALMQWWGLTIDTVSCINLVLCIGLCVDYSAHIGLHFLQVNGSRNERVRLTLKEMAPAVVNGAFSTFLSFLFLAVSDSHVFISFFKIFFGVFVFGVYNGLVFLPVLLSLIGAAPYNKDNIEAIQTDLHLPVPLKITNIDKYSKEKDDLLDKNLKQVDENRPADIELHSLKHVNNDSADGYKSNEENDDLLMKNLNKLSGREFDLSCENTETVDRNNDPSRGKPNIVDKRSNLSNDCLEEVKIHNDLTEKNEKD
uniref:Niemann-Pick C1 protein-like n=1 Tax=Hirondellea gigas TaxID=1518452 RepID=A0A2P2I6N8_9CRUS